MDEREWKRLPEKTLDVMKELGEFSPTASVQNREVKGYMIGADGEGGKTYFTSADLREIATACNEVAQWLDDRAAAAIGQQMKEQT